MSFQLSDSLDTASAPRELYRCASLRIIRSMLRRIQPPRHRRTDHVDPETYSRLPISITRLPFDTDYEIDFDTRFSKPFDEAKFNVIFADLFGTQGERLKLPEPDEYHDPPTDMWSEQWARMLKFAFLWERRNAQRDRDWKDIEPELIDYSQCLHPNVGFFDGQGLENINEFYPYTNPWSTHGVYVATRDVVPKPNESYEDRRPHVSCVLSHAVPMDGALPRSELTVILTLMKQRLRYQGWNSHAIIPVFLFSFNDTEARVTQAHFDGITLHLRQTDPMLLTDDPVPKIKTIFRWLMAEPLGDTLFHEAEELLGEGSHGAMQPPMTPNKATVSGVTPHAPPRIRTCA